MRPAPSLPLPRRRGRPAGWRADQHEMSCREIAAVLGLSTRMVEITLAGALRKVRAALGADWGRQ